MKQLIALATSAMTLWGMWLAGNKDWRGWLIGLLNQALWLVFIFAFAAWGLLPLSVALIVTYSRNLLAWRREDLTGKTCESCGQSARIRLRDGSTWCSTCDAAAIRLGYDDGSAA